MGKKWKFRESDKQNKEEIKKISEEYNINKIVAEIMVKRGIKDEDENIRKFLYPTRDDFYDPFLFKDMEKATARIIKAMENNEKILVFGDYDVDGITATTVLKRYFKDRGITIHTYIPNRVTEGYGLSFEAIDKIADMKIDLIITVDTGITGYEQVEYAKAREIDVIITDHHEPPEQTPNAVAVIDAKMQNSGYPFNGLAGCGVAFKLTQAISNKLGLKAEAYLKYLDIVAIGTISDIVPLEDENRTITKLGLLLLKMTKNSGLKGLIKVAGLKNVDEISVAFGMAPRINACGRLGHEEVALNLFLEDNPKEALAWAEELNDFNNKRREVEQKIYEEAIKQITEKNLEEAPAIILQGKGWHPGVIGIVSSKITEKYYKPSVLLCIENDGKTTRGSGRSVHGFNLYNAFTNSSEFIEQYGGHELAGGLTVKCENFENFKKSFEEYAKKQKIEEIEPEIYIDEEVKLKDVNINLANELKILAPFGEQNEVPIFLIKKLKIYSIRALSEGKHLKLTLADEDMNKIDAIGFNLGGYADTFKLGDEIDVLAKIEINTFNDRSNVQLNLVDLKNSY